MEKITLKTHPLYIWLDNNIKSYGINISKFKEIYSTYSQYNLTKNDILFLQNYSIEYLNEKLNYCIDNSDDDFNEKEIIGIYQILLNADKNKETLVWHPKTIFLIDILESGEKLIDNISPDIFKHKEYRDTCVENLIEHMFHIRNTYSLHTSEKMNKELNFYIYKFERYNKKIEWASVLKNRPSLYLALIAYEKGYELKSHDFINVFSSLRSHINRFSIHSLPESRIEEIAHLYSELLSQSEFFKATIVTRKKIHQAIEKLLNIKYNNTYSHGEYGLGNHIIAYKGYDVANYHEKMQRNLYFKIMGKHFLNADELVTFEQIQITSNNSKQNKKRIKI